MILLYLLVWYLMIKVMRMSIKTVMTFKELKKRYWLRVVIIYLMLILQIINFYQSVTVIIYGLIAFSYIFDANMDRQMIKMIEKYNEENKDNKENK